MKRTIPLHLRLSPEAHANAVRQAEQDRRPLATLLALVLEDHFASPAPADAATAREEGK